MRKFIGISMVVIGAFLIRALDWLAEISSLVGVVLVFLGLWLALTKSKIKDESQFVGGTGSENYDEVGDD